MGEMKPWQWVLALLAVVVLGVGLWMTFGGDRVPTASHFYMVDLVTGEVYKADISGQRAVSIPARHPETTERTLFPISREEDGGPWVIESRVREITGNFVDPDQFASVIDPATWAVDVDINSAKKYRYP